MKKEQNGFSAIEALLILVIIGIVGFVGWYVWNSKNKTDSIYNSASQVASSTASSGKSTPSKASNASNVSTDPYAGWETYCDAYYKYCFEYPSTWTIGSDNQVATSLGDLTSFTLTSPTQEAQVSYANAFSKDGGIDNVYTDLVKNLSTTSQSLTAVGYYQSASGSYYPEISIVDSGLLTTYPVSAGSTSSFVINSRFGDQGVAPSKYEGTFNAQPGASSKISSASDAQAWFSSTDTKTALLILESLYYKG